MIDIALRDIDVPLSPRGEQQATALGHWFASLPQNERPTVVFTSPYVRARQTTQRITTEAHFEYDGNPAPIIVDERFREKEFGILDRLTKFGIEQRYPDQAEFRQFLGKFYHRPPGGESWCDVILRLRSVFDTMSLHHSGPGKRVLIVAHQVIVLCARYLLEGLDEAQILAIDRERDVANCGVTWYSINPTLEDGGALQLRAHSFVAPLEEAGAPVTTRPDTPAGAK